MGVAGASKPDGYWMKMFRIIMALHEHVDRLMLGIQGDSHPKDEVFFWQPKIPMC